MPVDVSDESRISLYPVDLTAEKQINEVFQNFKPHTVIHTASPSYLDTTGALMKTNVEGTTALLRVSTDCPDTQAFVFTSSNSAVVPTQEPISEDDAQQVDKTNAPSVYGLSKAIAERLVASANSERLYTSILRIPGIYGEYDTNFVPQLVSSMRRKEHKMQVGNDNKLFEFLYVKKAAEAHILAMKALLDPKIRGQAGGEAFFISDGKPQYFFEFSRRFYAAAGNPVAPEEVTKIPFSVMEAMASMTEWLYWIFTLGMVQPSLRRISIDHLDKA
ncbi:erg26, C-3 sterol dehydrogenase [Fusarium chlamydosporum]